MTTGIATVRIYISSTRNGSLRRVLAAYLLYIAAEYGAWIAVTLYAYARGGATTACRHPQGKNHPNGLPFG